jgi:DNA-binding SARP family transcriptional activator
VLFQGENAWLDVGEFEALILTCERHAHGSTPDCPACLERLEHAAALYRGDFLAGISLRGCLDLEEWLTLKQEHFRQKMVLTTGRCSRSFEAQGNLEKALHYATWQSTLDPFNESSHRQVMRLLMYMERRAEALAHYSACERS